jgi:hypothetical protein
MEEKSTARNLHGGFGAAGDWKRSRRSTARQSSTLPTDSSLLGKWRVGTDAHTEANRTRGGKAEAQGARPEA